MATIVAAQSGNWSAGATWTGGVAPGVGDTAQSGAYTVTIDQNVTCAKIEATSSGLFAISVAHTITADVQGNSTSPGLSCSHSTGTVAIIGNVVPGTGTGCLNSSWGTLFVTGNVTGGSSQNAVGIWNGGGGNIQVTGTVTGGAASGSSAIYNYLSGGVAVTGDVIGAVGEGIYVNWAGSLVTVSGTVTGGSTGYGIHNANTGTVTVKRAIGGAGRAGLYGQDVGGVTTFKELQFGANTLASPIAGYCSMEVDVDVNQIIVKRSDTGADYGLSNDYPTVAQVELGIVYKLGTLEGTLEVVACDYPSEDDVRSGVTFDTYTGNMTLPAEEAVELDVTYGTNGTEFTGSLTGIVSAADIADAVLDELLSSHVIPGSLAAAITAIETATGDLATDAEIADAVRSELAAELALIDAATSTRSTVDAIWDEVRVDHADEGSYGAVAEWASAGGLTAQQTRDAMMLAPTAGSPEAGSVDAHLDAILLYGGGSGSGTYTDTITDGTNPLDGVRVQLSTDEAGANRVYETYTNASGVFVLNPDPGTYYRWLDLGGYSFTQGIEVIVS